MSQILSYSPGQLVTIFLETLGTDGYYSDGYYTDLPIDGYESPVIHKILNPLLAQLSVPTPMTRYDTGIYYHSFTLPSGASAVGSYFIDVQYRDDSGVLKANPYIVQVQAPFGLYSITSY